LKNFYFYSTLLLWYYRLQRIGNGHEPSMGKLFQFCQQGMAGSNIDFKY